MASSTNCIPWPKPPVRQFAEIKCLISQTRITVHGLLSKRWHLCRFLTPVRELRIRGLRGCLWQRQARRKKQWTRSGQKFHSQRLTLSANHELEFAIALCRLQECASSTVSACGVAALLELLAKDLSSSVDSRFHRSDR